jgi:hypothetical protein
MRKRMTRRQRNFPTPRNQNLERLRFRAISYAMRHRVMSVTSTTVGSLFLIWSAASAYLGIGFVLISPSFMAGMGTVFFLAGVVGFLKEKKTG